MRNRESEPTGASARLGRLRAAVSVGIADIEAGRYSEFETRADLMRRLSALREQVLADRGCDRAQGIQGPKAARL